MYKKIITITITVIIMVMRMLMIMIIHPIMNQKKRSLKKLTGIKQTKILKQTVMTPYHYPSTFLPRYPVLIPTNKQPCK